MNFPQLTDHVLPPLPYEVDALEPYIDGPTMALHHDKHHASYVKNLNKLVAATPSLIGKTAEWLLLNLRQLPEEIRVGVRNNAGGHVNHSLLWQSMSPAGGGAPSGALAKAINGSFGGFEEFKQQFESAGMKVFGCGWVWLVKPKLTDTLRVISTSGHDNPLSQGFIPLLVNDVWEHAYYLKHNNRRDGYLTSWWAVANWTEAAERLSRSQLDHKLARDISESAPDNQREDSRYRG